MIGNGSRVFVAVSLLALLAGCNSTDTSGTLDVGTGTKAATATPAPMVQGTCPQVILRDGTSFFRSYAKGAKVLPDGTKDPDKLMYQVSLAETTRQCVQSNGNLVITVMAQGRVVTGPAGGPGTVTMPIRVAVVDGDTTIYSELTQFQQQVTAEQPSAQFIFTKADVTVPTNITDLAQVFIGFDEGPVKAPKKKK